VVVGVAHTSLYGDIVIGIPYNKRHMFDTENQTNHVGSSGYGYRPSYGNRNSIATNNPYLGAPVATPNYRRASVATPYRRNPYADLDVDLSTSHYHRPTTGGKLNYYEDEDYDYPRRGPSSFTGLHARAQSAQRQLEGIPEFHVHSAAAPSRAVSSAPTFRAPYTNYYGGTGAPATTSYGSAPSYGPSAPAGSPGSKLPPKATKLPVSEARRKVRDLLCKTKNDPRYFDD
jgi:hypothetical protein